MGDAAASTTTTTAAAAPSAALATTTSSDGSEKRKSGKKGGKQKRPEVIVTSAVGFRVEGGGDPDEEAEAHEHAGQPWIDDPFDLSGKDNDFLFLREMIDNDAAQQLTFGAIPTAGQPVVVSIAKTTGTDGHLVGLIRTVQGTRRQTVATSTVKTPFYRKVFGLGPSPSATVRALDATLPPLRLIRAQEEVQQALLTMEEKQAIKGFKFGILYSAAGQTKEDDMFANVDGSPEFNEFIDFLGDRVKVLGFQGFRGGLDAKTNTTGEYGLYQKYNNCEIMFHVSTLLPHNPKDKQQLEKKRHIGNDIVVIIFQDGDTVYRPTTISSRQVHVVFLVKVARNKKDPANRYYRLAVVSKDGVPPFGPHLDEGSLYKKGPEFKELLYRKLLNAERASYFAPIFQLKLNRTRTALLTDIVETYGR